MKIRKLGMSGLDVAAIGLDRLGTSGICGEAKDRGEMIALIRAALDRSVAFFGTAGFYGPFVSEELLGALRSRPSSASRSPPPRAQAGSIADPHICAV